MRKCDHRVFSWFLFLSLETKRKDGVFQFCRLVKVTERKDDLVSLLLYHGRQCKKTIIVFFWSFCREGQSEKTMSSNFVDIFTVTERKDDLFSFSFYHGRPSKRTTIFICQAGQGEKCPLYWTVGFWLGTRP